MPGKNYASGQVKVLTLVFQTSLFSTELRDSGPTLYGVKCGVFFYAEAGTVCLPQV